MVFPCFLQPRLPGEAAPLPGVFMQRAVKKLVYLIGLTKFLVILPQLLYLLPPV